MTTVDTPMPGEDSVALPPDQRENERDQETDLDIEANPQPEPDSSLPPEEDDPAVEDTEQQPS